MKNSTRVFDSYKGAYIDKIDPFFHRQPDKAFIEELKSPVHLSAPLGFDSERDPSSGEVSARGIYIAERFPENEGLLDTAYADFERFCSLCKIGGKSYPVRFICDGSMEYESYRISVSADGCTVISGDTEGARRAIIYLEDEMTAREGPLLPLGEINRRAFVKARITRGFFSPTNRPPKYGDELLDDIDYYPDEYLNRLAHSGTNGLWIYTSFRALVKTKYFDDDPREIEKRLEKLTRVVAKCKRYGVGVYIFAIEPMGLLDGELEGRESFLGAKKRFRFHPICLRSEVAKSYIIEATEKLFSSVPDLAGYIDITAGERPTNCASGANFRTCPRCRKYSRGENLAYACDVIREGIRRANTGAKFISWTYGHRYWDNSDINEYSEKLPHDIIMMQNFEDRGYNRQLDRDRVAFDYWLSYPGPSELFTETAKMTAAHGNELWAKMQICTSHELATVPYIPAPGLVFDKYRAARELGVTGVMECWYFGNYPSVMSRASGELSFRDNLTDKDEFLRDFAARVYGKSAAEAISSAWREFEEGYKNYPTNIMFSYYGPMHDGVVWELSLIPKDNPLSRSWQLVDPPSGDRIGECLFLGHTLDEAITLSEMMLSHWKRGEELLPPRSGDTVTVAEAIGTLIASGLNILRFYKLRSDLGRERTDAKATLYEMRKIVQSEIEGSEKMLRLCIADSRLGYHSEAEGFKFFPEKLRWRIESLQTLLSEEFPEVEKRIAEGKHPLGHYFAEGMNPYVIGRDGFTELSDGSLFRVGIEDEELRLDIRIKSPRDIKVFYEFEPGFPECGVVFGEEPDPDNNPLETFLTGTGELRLDVAARSHQSAVGTLGDEELSKYRLEKSEGDGFVSYSLYRAIPRERWCGSGAMRMNLQVDEARWIKSDDPTYTLGKESQSSDEYGFLVLGD